MAPRAPAANKAVMSEKTALLEGDYVPPSKGLLSKLPASWVPYAELMRMGEPHGVYMIYFPHIVGLIYGSSAISTPVTPSTLLHRAGVFFVWTFFMRGAGCAWNDIVDQKVDRQTARCRTRPVARGAVTTAQGYLFTTVLTLLGFASLQILPLECTLVGLLTAVLTVIYPFGKRFTNYAQVILGSTLASTIALSAYSVGMPALSTAYVAPTMCLTATIMLLVVFYDVVYARVDTADDLKTGVKGMAVHFRNHFETLLAVVTGSIAGSLLTLGKLTEMGPYFYMFSVAGLSMSLISMIALVHWDYLAGWAGYSGYCYALAIANLLGGFVAEYSLKTVVA